jgi:hypothetical protein
MHNDHQEIMELKHEPEPGYLRTFFIAVSIGILYLVAIFLSA